jgi:hypothetical protein
MMSRNQPRPTKEEAQRMKIIKALGCELTWLKFGEKKYAEVHHILIGGKRAGHWYTIPLSPWYHQRTCEPGKTVEEMRARYGASTRDGSKAFVAAHHYTEWELWQRLQVVLGLDDSLPATKILPRRLGGNRHVAIATGLVSVTPVTASEPVEAPLLGAGPGNGDSAREGSEAAQGGHQ